MLAATFYRFVQRNIGTHSAKYVWNEFINYSYTGGTERFQDKRKYFEKELRKRNSVQVDDSLRPQVRITVSRFNLLEDVSTDILNGAVNHFCVTVLCRWLKLLEDSKLICGRESFSQCLVESWELMLEEWPENWLSVCVISCLEQLVKMVCSLDLMTAHKLW